MIDRITSIFSDLFEWGTTVTRFLREGEGTIEVDPAHIPPHNTEHRTPPTFSRRPVVANESKVRNGQTRFLLVPGDALAMTTARSLENQFARSAILQAGSGSFLEELKRQLAEMNHRPGSPVAVIAMGSDIVYHDVVKGIMAYLFPNEEWKSLGSDKVAERIQQSAIMVGVIDTQGHNSIANQIEAPVIRPDKGSWWKQINQSIDAWLYKNAHIWGGEFAPRTEPLPQPRAADVWKAREYLNSSKVVDRVLGVATLDKQDSRLFTHNVSLAPESMTEAVERNWRHPLKISVSPGTSVRTPELVASPSANAVRVQIRPVEKQNWMDHLAQVMTASKRSYVRRLGDWLLDMQGHQLTQTLHSGDSQKYSITEEGILDWSTAGPYVSVDGMVAGHSKTLELSALPALPHLTNQRQTTSYHRARAASSTARALMKTQSRQSALIRR